MGKEEYQKSGCLGKFLFAAVCREEDRVKGNSGFRSRSPIFGSSVAALLVAVTGDQLQNEGVGNGRQKHGEDGTADQKGEAQIRTEGGERLVALLHDDLAQRYLDPFVGNRLAYDPGAKVALERVDDEDGEVVAYEGAGYRAEFAGAQEDGGGNGKEQLDAKRQYAAVEHADCPYHCIRINIHWIDGVDDGDAVVPSE